jgi:uncharacterized protein YceK
VASFLLGCQTLRSWQGGCPGVYSGVKYYREQVDFLPFDGKVFFTFDLPLTALLDTLALPVTYFLSPEQPQGGFAIGCKWARGK